MKIKTEKDEEDASRKKEFLIQANKDLLQAISTLSQRQQVLEEYIEVELGVIKGVLPFDRYRGNKRRVKYALGIKDGDDQLLTEDGQRTEKLNRMIKILKVANSYWKQEHSRINRPSNTQSRLRYEQSVPKELAELNLHVDWDDGLIKRKPVKRCHKCLEESHEMKYCPYKLAESRTPEIEAMIQARYLEIREREMNDPLLSKAYKERMFHPDRVKEKVRQKQVSKVEKRLMKLKTRMEDGGVKISPHQLRKAEKKLEKLNEKKRKLQT